ncbi:MAG TPA: heme-binding protein [Mycobacterium sp.]|nr:heme-binding protein [Mycobacterium sp.]
MKLFVSSALIGAALIAGTPLAHADTGANGPGCTAADLEFVRAGVQEATGQYLSAHSDVNDFYNSLEGLTRDQSTTKVQAYMKAHPQTKTDITAIRQPLQDIKSRCAATP